MRFGLKIRTQNDADSAIIAKQRPKEPPVTGPIRVEILQS